MKVLFMILLLPWSVFGQAIGTDLPNDIKPSEKYLFYLHGQIVTDLGDNAVSQSFPEWGAYEYTGILDSLRNRGFNVISQIRKKDVADSVYAVTIAAQIHQLLKSGVRAGHILVVGASAGWSIGLSVSSRVRNKDIRYVLMGGCWPDSYKAYSSLELYGHFLSIIEKSDPHGTCASIFENRKTLSSYRELVLHTGHSHGFIFKGYPEWIDPVVSWEKVTGIR